MPNAAPVRVVGAADALAALLAQGAVSDNSAAAPSVLFAKLPAFASRALLARGATPAAGADKSGGLHSLEVVAPDAAAATDGSADEAIATLQVRVPHPTTAAASAASQTGPPGAAVSSSLRLCAIPDGEPHKGLATLRVALVQGSELMLAGKAAIECQAKFSLADPGLALYERGRKRTAQERARARAEAAAKVTAARGARTVAFAAEMEQRTARTRLGRPIAGDPIEIVVGAFAAVWRERLENQGGSAAADGGSDHDAPPALEQGLVHSRLSELRRAEVNEVLRKVADFDRGSRQFVLKPECQAMARHMLRRAADE